MNAVKTIDVKGLDHAGKEGLIFPGVAALGDGDTLRIVLDFNPLPLVYVLKAQDKFNIAYEKEGPDEWILKVLRTGGKEDKKEQFKKLLNELKGGKVSEATQEKARTLLQSVDARTLAVMEQELIREGVSHDEIRESLCGIHLDIIKDSLVAKRTEVSAPHPVHTFMQEHELILVNLKELGGLLKRLKGAASFKSMGPDLGKLEELAHHLVEVEPHYQREEDVLFPALEKHDIVEPVKIMKLDHVEFRARKKKLYKLTRSHKDCDFHEYKAAALELGEYLVKELDSHIFKENNILYQIALQVLSEKEWAEIKKGCDKIGYCCFSPNDATDRQAVLTAIGPDTAPAQVLTVELDLRPLPPPERHHKIFEAWNKLNTGQTLKIVNDHDPKPLRYQFEAEYRNHHVWEYEKSGPVDWVVRITKK